MLARTRIPHDSKLRSLAEGLASAPPRGAQNRSGTVCILRNTSPSPPSLQYLTRPPLHLPTSHPLRTALTGRIFAFQQQQHLGRPPPPPPPPRHVQRLRIPPHRGAQVRLPQGAGAGRRERGRLRRKVGRSVGRGQCHIIGLRFWVYFLALKIVDKFSGE